MNPEIEMITTAAEDSIVGPAFVPFPFEKIEYCHIFRAPAPIRYGRGYDFEPKLVSIGPYYHGRENLKPMEQLKLRCMSDLLKRHPVGAHNIYLVPVDPFMIVARYARLFYKEEISHSDVDFVRMLVLDSFFIIRIIVSLSQVVHESLAFLDANIKEVRSDLLLLENQIPLFFIRKVYDWLFLFPHSNNQKFPHFETVVEPFIWLDMPWRFNHGGMSMEAAHLLDLYWRCSSAPEINEQLNNFRRCGFEQEQPSWAEIHLPINAPKVIANATVLHQMAGIKYEKLNDEGHHAIRKGLDVKFSNGIMRMPCLKIDSRQTTLLVNLIAFENSVLPASIRPINSYIKLMNELIDSEKDVELLQQCGVIYNTLSSHMMAATFFNDIVNFCLINDNTNLFSDLYANVQKYYESIWNRRWASLRHNYFSSPWAGISVIAGVTLLILSALQTFYTIYGYYYPKH